MKLVTSCCAAVRSYVAGQYLPNQQRMYIGILLTSSASLALAGGLPFFVDCHKPFLPFTCPLAVIAYEVEVCV